jgi:hypothetical protein
MFASTIRAKLMLFYSGQRLAAQKGESTDIVEAMKAKERVDQNDSDEEE